MSSSQMRMLSNRSFGMMPVRDDCRLLTALVVPCKTLVGV